MSKILIVDDDHEIVTILTEILTHDGHEVESARETSEGMRKARSYHPDLVILDFHMPGANGAHLFESLRRNQASQATPVLFLSGEATPEDILSEVADPSGAQFLAKPIRLEDFRKAVRKILKGKPHG